MFVGGVIIASLDFRIMIGLTEFAVRIQEHKRKELINNKCEVCMIHKADDFKDDIPMTTANIECKWVILRPANYKFRSFGQRIK